MPPHTLLPPHTFPWCLCRLHKMYLFQAPGIFLGLWKIVSPFVVRNH